MNKKGIFKGNLNFKKESECCYCITSKPVSTMRMSRLQIPLSYFLSPTKHTALHDSENFSRSRLITRSSPFLFSTRRWRIKDHTRDVTKRDKQERREMIKTNIFPRSCIRVWKRSKTHPSQGSWHHLSNDPRSPPKKIDLMPLPSAAPASIGWNYSPPLIPRLPYQQWPNGFV